MGISVSNSECNYKVQILKEQKRLKHRQVVGHQFQKTAINILQPYGFNQNQQPSTTPNIVSRRRLTKIRQPIHPQSDDIFSTEQKKATIKSSDTFLSLPLPTLKSNLSIASQERSHSQSGVEPVKSENEKELKYPQEGGSIQINVRECSRVNLSANKGRKQTPKRKQSIGNTLTRSRNSSFRVSANKLSLPLVQRNDMQVEIRKMSFNHSGSKLPTQEDDISFSNKKILAPPVNVVISKKCRSSVNQFREVENEQIVSKYVKQQVAIPKKSSVAAAKSFKFVPMNKFQSVGTLGSRCAQPM